VPITEELLNIGDTYADVLERLFIAYESRHALTTIAGVTAQGRADLEGQVPAQAQPELLERLVRARLDAVSAHEETRCGHSQ
jgi:hypothetical protein